MIALVGVTEGTTAAPGTTTKTVGAVDGLDKEGENVGDKLGKLTEGEPVGDVDDSKRLRLAVSGFVSGLDGAKLGEALCTEGS